MSFQNTYRYMQLRTLGHLVCLGFAGVSITAHRGEAQDPRLSVRPREMATGTRTAQAGERSLDALNGALIYVPPSCVGPQRCPLVVLLHGGGGSARYVMDRQHQFADKYGMIILAPNAVTPGVWDVIAETPRSRATQRALKKLNDDLKKINGDPAAVNAALNTLNNVVETHQDSVDAVRTNQDVKNIDAAMKLVLREYAIDPKRIAVTGMSDGGSYSNFLGRNNQEVFSRVAPESPGYAFADGDQGQTNTQTQFLCVTGLEENGDFLVNPFKVAQAERATGHVVELAVILRPHEGRSEDEDLIWSWIQKSWATPGIPVLTAPHADTTVVLTPGILAAMTTFWTRFMQEPASIQTDGRQAHQKRVMMRVGQQHVVLPMMDLAAMSTTYPSVAADLKAAGLTAQQAEAYRVAFISARATQRVQGAAGSVEENSVLGKNIMFLTAYASDVQTLSTMAFWVTP